MKMSWKCLFLVAPEKEYEEFCAEVNDNVLIVRVTKANRKVTRVCEEMESCENDYPCKYHITNLNMKCSDDGDNVCSIIFFSNLPEISTTNILVNCGSSKRSRKIYKQLRYSGYQW